MFENEKGTITSPNYPAIYPNKQHCKYLIKMPQNFKINITFSTPFKLENEANCSYDSLKIFDGETANSLAILGPTYGYCGFNIPPSVISSGNSLLILFESDGNNAFYGFNLTYTKGKLNFFGILVPVSYAVFVK